MAPAREGTKRAMTPPVEGYQVRSGSAACSPASTCTSSCRSLQRTPSRLKWSGTRSARTLGKEGSPNDVEQLKRIQALSEEVSRDIKESSDNEARERKVRMEADRKRRGQLKVQLDRSVRGILDANKIADDASGCASSLMNRLQHEHYAVGAALLVCERRLELRTGRPQEDETLDDVKEALVFEQDVLLTARDAMLALGNEVTRVTDQLSQVRGDISREKAQIRREVTCADRYQAATPSNSSAPSTPRTPRTAAELWETSTGLHNLADRIDHVLNLQGVVEELRRRTDKLIDNCSRATGQATRRVHDGLQRRASEQKKVVQNARIHLQKADHALTVAEQALERSVRKLNPNDTRSLAIFAANKSRVEEALSLRKSLGENVWAGKQILNVDEACLRVTPQWAASGDGTPRRRLSGRTC
eukprot:TRINITY_DN40472_c0_g1_i1.p1 TRINITY_DN40472_c0_g1~~TRINITY_DN40472_c0_g1_i1.p1  ORF type:complete len:432 (+),score=67.96 TRINITY_DN40472_c0_g1_i1:47-1297(+)